MSEMNMENIIPAQMEFFTEEAMIKIVPNFSYQEMNLSTISLKSFSPNLPIEVPLWLALFLKSKDKCRIRIPDLYEVETLERRVEEERTVKGFLKPLPNNFFEMFKLLYSR